MLTNTFVNYLLLTCTARLLRTRPRLWRTLTASLAGGLLSLSIFTQGPWSIAIKVLGAMLMVWITYSYQHMRRYIKALLFFFGVSFLFAGLMLALYYFVSPPGMIYDGTLVYFDISALSFVLFSMLSYAILSLLAHLFGEKRRGRDEIVAVEVRIAGRSTIVNAKLDTGNNLVDVFSGVPVLVCELQALQPVIPASLQPLVEAALEGRVPGDLHVPRTSGFRLIPCRTVAGQALMPALRPELIKIYDGDTVSLIRDVTIGLVRGRIVSSEYSMLLNPNLPEGIQRGVKKDEVAS